MGFEDRRRVRNYVMLAHTPLIDWTRSAMRHADTAKEVSGTLWDGSRAPLVSRTVGTGTGEIHSRKQCVTSRGGPGRPQLRPAPMSRIDAARAWQPHVLIEQCWSSTCANGMAGDKKNVLRARTNFSHTHCAYLDVRHVRANIRQRKYRCYNGVCTKIRWLLYCAV